jgi:hypothetical protein
VILNSGTFLVYAHEHVQEHVHGHVLVKPMAIDQDLYLILLATCCPCNETLATLHEAITALDNPTELNINLAIYAKVRAAQIKSTPIKLTPVSNTPLFKTPLFKTPLLNIPSYIITVASLVFAINLLT